jgi:hypothetical protein
MYRRSADNVLVLLVSALRVASIILTDSFIAFGKNVQFETSVMKKEHSQLLLILSDLRDRG